MNRDSLKWMRSCVIVLMLLTTFGVSWSLLPEGSTPDPTLYSPELRRGKVEGVAYKQVPPLAIEDLNGMFAASETDVENRASYQEGSINDHETTARSIGSLPYESTFAGRKLQVERSLVSRDVGSEVPDYSGLLASIGEVTGYSVPFEPEFFYPVDQAEFFVEISASQRSDAGGSKSERTSYSGANPQASQTKEDQNGLVIESTEKDGIKVKDAWHDGVNVVKAHRGLNVGRAYGPAVNVGFSHDDGLYVDSADVNGMDIDHVGDDGIQIFRAGKDGLVIYNATEEGIDAVGDRGNLLRTNSPNFYGLYVYSYGASPSNPGLYVAGTFYATGTKSSVVPTSRGVEPLYAVESPEVEFVTSGTAQLAKGECQVTFDRLFREAISQEIPLRIILTPKDTWTGLYVTEKSYQGFRVKATGGAMNAEFDWLAIGRRKGYERTPDSPFLNK